MQNRSLVALVALALTAGCEASSTPSNANAATNAASDTASTADASSSADTAPAASADAASPNAGNCTYTNPFSKGQECKRYSGAAWTSASAASDCQAPMAGVTGTYDPTGSCPSGAQLGTCTVGDASQKGYVLVSPGADSASCTLAKIGCETFAKGAFASGETCGGTASTGGTTTGGGSGEQPSAGGGKVFVQPYELCQAPKNGEAAGQGPGGKVCANVAISGATEAGRKFADYANCADVRTQRPYWPGPIDHETAKNDPRLQDKVYMAEVEWARQQVAATGCACCHSNKHAPSGPSNWDIDGQGIWLDHLHDSGVAILGGLVGSAAFGAYPPEQNHGFNRTILGVPTTDVPRMQKLLLGEWSRRGLGDQDKAKYSDFGGPLVDQAKFVPQPCAKDEGVDAQGKLQWGSSTARYVYVLAADSANPGVPPNLDKPAGALWFADVPTAAQPMQSGIVYGQLSGTMRQRLPEQGPAPALKSGATYYIYALYDIGVPVTRCLFTAK